VEPEPLVEPEPPGVVDVGVVPRWTGWFVPLRTLTVCVVERRVPPCVWTSVWCVLVVRVAEW
jgi:hypothetical protein